MSNNFSSVDNFASNKSFDLDALFAAVIDFLSVFFGKLLHFTSFSYKIVLASSGSMIRQA